MPSETIFENQVQIPKPKLLIISKASAGRPDNNAWVRG